MKLQLRTALTAAAALTAAVAALPAHAERVYGVANAYHQRDSCDHGCAYGWFATPQAACREAAVHEIRAGFPQYGALHWDGYGCFDGNRADGVGGYPAYVYHVDRSVARFGVMNHAGQRDSCDAGCPYPWFATPQAACAEASRHEALAGFPQYSNLHFDGNGCFDGTRDDAVGGYPAYVYRR